MYLQRIYCRGNGEKISANTDPGYSARSRKTERAQRNRPGDKVTTRTSLARRKRHVLHEASVAQMKKASKTLTCPVPRPFSGETVTDGRRQNRL
ncbi:hypothetical protein PS639_04809 [Pseudomonas fluorescens]|nr:hypothetical protein PS639_04809 [Pseudomonas fluorescens]